MTEQLPVGTLRRGDRRGLRRLPGRALALRGAVLRQGMIGLAAGGACAGALAVVAVSARLDAAWTAAVDDRLIIVPDPADHLVAALAAAGPGARTVSAASIAGLFVGADAPGLAPGLITTSSRDPALAGRLQEAAPESLVEDNGGAPARRLAAFGHRLHAAAAVAGGLLALAAVAALIRGAQTAVVRAAGSVRLLHRLGMTRAALARRVAGPLAVAAFLGAAVSAMVAGGTAFLIDSDAGSWRLVLCLPLIALLLTASAVGPAIRRTLRAAR